MPAAGGCSRRGAACAASPPTRSGGSLPGWRQRSRRLGAEGWFRSRRRSWSCFRRERLSPGRRGRCSASPWCERSSACTLPCHAHRAPRRVPPPLSDRPASPPRSSCRPSPAPTTWKRPNRRGGRTWPRPRPSGAGFSPTPPPGLMSGAIRLLPFSPRSRRPRPGSARQRRRTAPSCERVNPSPLSFGAGAETTMAKPRWPLSISTIAAFPAARWRSSHDCCA